ncbi:efflux RND transporter permease subunit [Immundisolibacter cernigliae]|uniref:Acriflavin resistance protein n=1 Tax=Immundisolibacter cernigliae TaxID=1810504 RepID=A0A1B1YU52_9GAMM|nr:efflux RND transporter permease subunit [Immundisolibacter cernigliae]ANX04400.1 acriflavin resistance protein [Immundisolibacter cernigliae]
MLEGIIRHGVVVAVAALVVCLLGAAAIFRVPVQMIPDMDITSLTVTTAWPGAAPQDVEREILIEQEEYLRSIPGLARMTAEATTGGASIELEFGLGRNLSEVLALTNNALSQVPRYPDNVDRPRIFTTAFSDNYFMFYVIQPAAGNPRGLDIEGQFDFVEDHVKAALERTPGVAEVKVEGGAERQLRVYVDPARLAQRRIRLSELRDALLARNQDMSGGDIDAGKRRYLVRTLGRFEDVADVQDTIVAQRDGTPVYVRDLARTELTHAELRTHSRFGGEPGLMVMVKKQRGTNVVEVERAVTATAQRLQQTVLPAAGLQMHLMHSDVNYVRQAVGVVRENLILGALLAVLALYLFLRRATPTLIGALGIPVATLAAFIGLLWAGRTINVVSLAGVALAIGMTLDNNIVVLENIHRHRAAGRRGLDAVLAGTREVWGAVLASTATTVIVFIPLLLVREEAGQLYSDIAIAISAAIIASLLVALTLVPVAEARFASAAGEAPTTGLLQRVGQGFAGVYTRLLGWLLRSRARSAGYVAAVALVAGAVALLLTPRAEYLPEGEEAVTFSMLFPPPGYNLATMDRIGREIDAVFAPHLGREAADFDPARDDIPPLRWFMTNASAGGLEIIAGTRDRAHITPLIETLGRRFADYPGMISFSARGSIFSGNEGGTRSMELDISGENLQQLFDLGLKAFLKTREVLHDPQILPDPPSLSLGQPFIEVRPDWERAAELGLGADELGYLVWALADGAYHDDFYLGDRKVDLFLYGSERPPQRPADLAALPLYTERGGIVPLSAVAQLRETVDTDTIRRLNGQRTVTLNIVSPSDMPLETAVQKVEIEVIGALRAAGQVPAGVHITIGGASDKLAATRAALADNMLLALALTYLIMVAILRHWGYPLVIMLTVPLGYAGGVLGLWVMNAVGIAATFDMITVLGFLVLIGVVVNNPILLVERHRENLAAGRTPVDALLDAARTRLRPIMMTTLTTLFGLFPLVFLPREGTELYRGLGIVLLFGLLFSTLVTLSFTPCLLRVLRRDGPQTAHPA